MTHATGEHPAETDDTVHPTQDDATVQHLLEEGPQGPQGRVAMAAAGVDVDDRFPVEDADGNPEDQATDPSPVDENVDENVEENADENTDENADMADPATAPDTPAAAAPVTPAESTATGPSVLREPLISAEMEQEFLSRWKAIQIGFVEDPAQSVRNADALVQDISGAYVAAIANRREALSASWQHDDAGTEELRQALRQYRSFLGVVLPR